MDFCEYCGQILQDDGRCPWVDCPHNAIIDIMAAVSEDDNKADKQEATT